MIVLVLGGQYGDEGKGGVTQWFAQNWKFDLVIRFGGSNAGHACEKQGEVFEMRSLPCTWGVSEAPIYIPPTALIDKDVFLNEVDLVRGHGYGGSIFLSPEATLIDPKDLGWRKRTKKIGSMGSGVAPTRAKRLLREAVKVYDDPDFIVSKEWSNDVRSVRQILENPKSDILVEGTQGFGLSLNFSGCYPYTTSVDLTPYQVLAECGVPFGVHKVNVALVFRTFPVRVPNPPNGTSGWLVEELTWEGVQEICGHPIEIEYDQRLPIWKDKQRKRIGIFEQAMVRKALWYCRPEFVFMTHLDWFIPDMAETGLTSEVNAKLLYYERVMERSIDFISAKRGVFLPASDTVRRYGSAVFDLK